MAMEDHVRKRQRSTAVAKRCAIWLEIASKDLFAAEYLFGQKMYPQAVFYLEQSIEKAIKSLGIWSGLITESEARDNIGHKAREIYLRMLDKSKNALTKLKWRLPLLPSKYGAIDGTQIDATVSELDWLQKMYPDESSLLHISTSGRDIRNILTTIIIMRKALVDGLGRKGTELVEVATDNEKFSEYRRLAYQRLEARQDASRETLQKEKIAFDGLVTPEFLLTYGKMLRTVAYQQFCYQSLLLLFGALSPHVARSRYPARGINPLEVYTDHLPLVQMLGSVIGISKQTLETLGLLFFEVSDLAKKQSSL